MIGKLRKTGPAIYSGTIERMAMVTIDLIIIAILTNIVDYAIFTAHHFPSIQHISSAQHDGTEKTDSHNDLTERYQQILSNDELMEKYRQFFREVRIANMIITTSYYIYFWTKHGASPAQMIFGAKIIDKQTHKYPTINKATIRYVGLILSVIPLFLGILWTAINRKGQGWHDMLSGTIVVREPFWLTHQGHHITPTDTPKNKNDSFLMQHQDTAKDSQQSQP